MKALRWHGPRDLRLVELVEPVLEAGEVRIRVAYCGICGSDLHEYVDGPHAIPVDCPHPISGRRAPLTLGHEFCGTVVESADPGVRAGTRVAVEPEYRCGRCNYCRLGQYNRCIDMGFVGLMGDGAFAETVVVPSYTVHPLPDEVNFDQAAVFEHRARIARSQSARPDGVQGRHLRHRQPRVAAHGKRRLHKSQVKVLVSPNGALPVDGGYLTV